MLACEYNKRYASHLDDENNTLSQKTSQLYSSNSPTKSRRSKYDAFNHWANMSLPKDQPITTRELLPKIKYMPWFQIVISKTDVGTGKDTIKRVAQKLTLAWNKKIHRKKINHQ